MIHRKLRSRVQWTFCAVVLAGGTIAGAQTKVWSVQLDSLGWEDPFKVTVAPAKATKDHHGEAGTDRTLRLQSQRTSAPYDPDLGTIYRQELTINAAGQVEAGFGMHPKDPKTKALRVVTLDGEHGSLVRQMDFPTPILDRTALFSAADGALLVVAADRVQRVNADGTMGSSIAIPPQPKINPALWIHQSPSGKTLLMTTDEKFFQFVRSDTLATVAECRTEIDEIDKLNDSMALSMAENASHQFEMHAGPFCGPMPLLWSLAGGRSSSSYPLEDGSVIEIGLNQVRRLTLTDKTLWEWAAPAEMVPSDNDGMAMSSNGKRMAVELTAYRQLRSPGCMECKGPEFQSWGAGIAVLDLATGKLVTRVPLDHTQLNWLGIALSPDGRRLAVLSRGRLEMWAI